MDTREFVWEERRQEMWMILLKERDKVGPGDQNQSKCRFSCVRASSNITNNANITAACVPNTNKIFLLSNSTCLGYVLAVSLFHSDWDLRLLNLEN